MICSTCGTPIPEHHLDCLACCAQKYFEELRDRQRDFLPQVVAEKLDVRLAKTQSNVRHILLFGSDRITYCGQDLDRYQRKYCEYDAGRLVPSICPACRQEFTKAIEEVIGTP